MARRPRIPLVGRSVLITGPRGASGQSWRARPRPAVRGSRSSGSSRNCWCRWPTGWAQSTCGSSATSPTPRRCPTWIDTDLVRDTEAALPSFAATRRQLPGPPGAYTSVEACAEALVHNLETRRRRVFVPRPVGVVSALRQVVTGALAERAVLRISAGRVPRLEGDIAALQGEEFGRHSTGARRAG